MESISFQGLVDLAAERAGGEALFANDEFFAPKENLLKPGRGVFLPDKYPDRGKWMDGWETRRRRTPGHDWCILKLGLPGTIKGVDIDTNHFLGNHPPYAAIDACEVEENTSPDLLVNNPGLWSEILPKSPIKPGAQNLFSISNSQRWTHIRLKIYPDGGVARLRIYGTVVPDWQHGKQGEPVDLAAIENGGMAVACSDMFFSDMNNMLLPGMPRNMGEGWETKRRRGPGHDWAIVKLARPGKIQRLEIYTTHFKGNYPDHCSLEGLFAPGEQIDALTLPDFSWQEILPKTKLQADARHELTELRFQDKSFSHVKLNIFPDGGIARLRVWGKFSC
jgi:allantoicase